MTEHGMQDTQGWPPKKKDFIVRIRPNAKANEIRGWDEKNRYYVIAVASAPIDGSANRELLRFLRNELGTRVQIVSGFAGRTKKIRAA